MRKNPNAPRTPFAMPQYRLTSCRHACGRTQTGVELRARRRAVRGLPLLRRLTLTVGCVVFLGTLIWIATSPVSISV